MYIRQSTVMNRREDAYVAELYFAQALNRNVPLMRHLAAQKDARASLQACPQDHAQCTREL